VINPFRFGGADYRSARDLAAAFAASEAPWLAPADYIGFIRTWHESNLMFEEAARLGEETGDNPGLALFRFVHSNAPLPFSLMGHIADANNLYIFL